METLGSIPACAGNQARIKRPAVYHGSIPACAGEPSSGARRGSGR